MRHYITKGGWVGDDHPYKYKGAVLGQSELVYFTSPATFISDKAKIKNKKKGDIWTT